MKDLLNKQPKEVLVKIAKQVFDGEDLLKVDSFNTQTLVSRITKIVEDEASGYNEEDINRMIVEATAVKKEEPKVEKKEEQSATISTPQDLTNKAVASAKADLLRLQKEQKKRALELVVVNVTPRDKRDISIGKKGEVVSIENQFFALSKFIPFNNPVEIPRCVAENLADIFIPVVYENNDPKANTLHKVVMEPKYAVTYIRGEQ